MVSVCTLVHGRDSHLRRMIRGLEAQSKLPEELVVVRMNEEPDPALSSPAFPVRQYTISAGYLPLAEARNVAARYAKSETLIFLDVDCIPGPTLVTAYSNEIADSPETILFGPVRYAQASTKLDQEFSSLWDECLVHPARLDPSTEKRKRVNVQGSELWGLSFGLSRTVFDSVDGFDPAFQGYGGEETDFALRLIQSDARFVWLREARAVHQYHPVSVPPLHHFDDIVRNAQRFHEKHGQWPMEYWLKQFEEASLIERNNDIKVLRQPTIGEIEAARMPGDVAFS